jgi:hypothetical protein
MGHWKILELLYHLSPVRVWKARLVRHMENCPACSAKLADREEARRLLVQAEDLDRLDDIWPSVKAALRPLPGSPSKNRSGFPGAFRWTAVAGGLAAAAFLLIGTVRYLGNASQGDGRGRFLDGTGGFVLHSARIENEPANTYIIHPPDDGMVVIWVEKNI